MLEVALRCGLAGVLAVAALLKLASPRRSHAALATFGLVGSRTRWIALGYLVVAELALAAGVLAGVDGAPYAAAALMAVFALAQLAALRSGRAGAPCACFGARSRLTLGGVARDATLAAAFAALALLPRGELSTDEWLGLGLGVALLACAALAAAVLALAREVGMLRLALGPQAALEIPEEGPELGARTSLISRFQRDDRTESALAVFVSEGCRMCRALEPAIDNLSRDRLVALETFDEREDADVWAELDVPGSPYAVALDPSGIVLAKGTVNSLGHLESVLAAAERRREGELAAPEGIRA